MEDQRLADVPPVLLLGWRGVVQENDDGHAGDGGDRGEDETGQEEHGKSAKKAEKAGRPVEVAEARSDKEFQTNAQLVDDLPEVGCGGEVEAHASQVDGRVGEEKQAGGDLRDGVQASDEETELDENARDENSNNWVALVGASGDEVKEEAKDIVLSDGADQPACADQVAEGGGPGGEDHPDEDEAVPEGELGHVEAVVEEEGGGAGQRCEQGKK